MSLSYCVKRLRQNCSLSHRVKPDIYIYIYIRSGHAVVLVLPEQTLKAADVKGKYFHLENNPISDFCPSLWSSSAAPPSLARCQLVLDLSSEPRQS